MCLTTSKLQRSHPYNWAGDLIVSPLVPAARRVPGSSRVTLDIDVREFLAIDHCAEVRNFFLKYVVEPCNCMDRDKFFIGRHGNFDFRARRVLEAFGRFSYKPVKGRSREEWLFPAETLAREGGDCEDLAFLLMAMLEESGISRACLRLAFGELAEVKGSGRESKHDHVWVMYKTEGGAWVVVDPVERCERPALKPVAQARNGAAFKMPKTSFEYRPLFVLNRDHLWRVQGPRVEGLVGDLPSYLGARTFWSHYDPAFAKGVHEDIFDHVMGSTLTSAELSTVKSASLWLDVNVMTYDPRDHCDFSYIDESWQRIESRLSSGDLADMGRACHTVADFYAHTLYDRVVQPTGKRLPLYDPATPPNIGNQLDFVFDRGFPINNGSPTLSPAEAKQYWQGKLLSGQWWRWFTTYPDDIQNAAELDPRRCLPDHDSLAVDDKRLDSETRNHLYPSATAHNKAFELRFNTAVKHVESVFQKWVAAQR